MEQNRHLRNFLAERKNPIIFFFLSSQFFLKKEREIYILCIFLYIHKHGKNVHCPKWLFGGQLPKITEKKMEIYTALRDSQIQPR